MENQQELWGVLDEIEGIKWEKVPADQRKPGNPRSIEHSPGRQGPGGDIIWCNTWEET